MRSRSEVAFAVGRNLLVAAGAVLSSSLLIGPRLSSELSLVRRRIDDVRVLNRLPVDEKLSRFRQGSAVLACRPGAVGAHAQDSDIRRSFESGACILKTAADLPPPSVKSRRAYVYFTSKGPA